MKKICFKITVVIFIFMAASFSVEASDRDVMKQRIINELTCDFDLEINENTFADKMREKLISSAKKYVNNMNENGVWDDAYNTISSTNDAFGRVLTIARASKINRNSQEAALWDLKVKRAVSLLSEKYY